MAWCDLTGGFGPWLYVSTAILLRHVIKKMINQVQISGFRHAVKGKESGSHDDRFHRPILFLKYAPVLWVPGSLGQ